MTTGLSASGLQTVSKRKRDPSRTLATCFAQYQMKPSEEARQHPSAAGPPLEELMRDLPKTQMLQTHYA